MQIELKDKLEDLQVGFYEQELCNTSHKMIGLSFGYLFMTVRQNVAS